MRRANEKEEEKGAVRRSRTSTPRCLSKSQQAHQLHQFNRFSSVCSWHKNWEETCKPTWLSREKTRRRALVQVSVGCSSL